MSALRHGRARSAARRPACRCRAARRRPASISQTRSSWAAINVLAPASPVSASISGKKRRAHSTGIAALVLVHGDANGAAVGRRERRDHAVDQRRGDLRHVAEQHERAIARRQARRECPPSSDVLRPSRNADCARSAHRARKARLRSSPTLMAGDDDDGLRIAGERGLDGPAQKRLAAPFGEQLVGAHARRKPGRQHDRGNARRAQWRVLGIARLRPGRDFLQQTAHAHAHDVRARHGKPANKRCSTKSKPFTLGERAQLGRPDHRFAVQTPQAAADCLDRPACRNGATAPPAATMPAGMTSRRSVIAEAPNTNRRSAPAASPSRTARRRPRRRRGRSGARTRACPKAAQGAPRARSGSCRGATAFWPGSCGRHQRDAHRLERRDPDRALCRRADRRINRRARVRRRE